MKKMKTNNKTLRIEELINDSINSNQFNEESTSKVRYDYFIKKKEMLIKKFNKLCVRIEGKIAKSYNKNFAVRIIFQAKKEYKDLIPRIPYFGGIINPFNEIIIIVAQMAAVHKSMKQNGKSAEETVLIFYDIVDDLFKRMPKLFLCFGQKFVFSPVFIKLMQKISKRMSEMNDPNGFDFHYYKDNSKENDWHFVAKRCGIVNFFRQEGCEDLAPYCNFVNAIQGKAFNMGVHCKACLGAGDATCEEYMKQGRETVIPERICRLLEQKSAILKAK